jgi:ABC-2 type transport system permease protein
LSVQQAVPQFRQLIAIYSPNGGYYPLGPWAGLTLIALLSLGLAAAVRDPAAAIGLVLGVLYLFPLAASLVSSPALARHLDQIGPLPAGLDAQATIAVHGLPLTPWQGLGVVALWAAGALLLGALVLKIRDA